MTNDTAQHQLLLERFARATHTKVVTSLSDIGMKDHVLGDMANWCKKHGKIVVLRSGSILSSEPSSRDIQNCKSVLISKGMPPGRVFAATQDIISLLLANTTDTLNNNPNSITSITDRQQHLRNLVSEAIVKNISDIHIEVRKDLAKVRLRQHGRLELYAEWSEKLGREIAAVAFNKETDHATSHFNPLIPQDASMPLNMEGRDVRLRLASVPAHGGFDMVMRILATGNDEAPKLNELGYTEQQKLLISQALEHPHGAIIVAGPTGSGKTTTLASCMEMVPSTRKIYSIEDPVEKVVEAATQVPVNTDKEDRSFASMGRAALRMDPDVIILGEMRDEDTVQVMIRAAITGHLVLTTLHTSSASGIVTRMMDMGTSPMLLSDSNVLRLLIFQRLVVKLCPSCAIPLEQSAKHAPFLGPWRDEMGDLSTIKAKGHGCEQCNQSGIAGRTVIAELIWVDDEGREFIKSGDTLGWEKYLKQQGWTNYQSHAIDLVKQGTCDPLDIEEVIGKIGLTGNNDRFSYKKMS